MENEYLPVITSDDEAYSFFTGNFVLRAIPEIQDMVYYLCRIEELLMHYCREYYVDSGERLEEIALEILERNKMASFLMDGGKCVAVMNPVQSDFGVEYIERDKDMPICQI